MKGATLAPEDSLLETKTEIAILVKDESIFSLTDSLDRLLEAYRFESCYFYWTKDVSVQLYKDGHGNILIIEYDFNNMSEKRDGHEIFVSGISVKPMAELYTQSLRKVEKIDLRDYIEIYPENVFPKAFEKVIRCFLIKAKNAEESDRTMYA